jgi:hypothetical protein
MNYNGVQTFIASVALSAHQIVKFTTYTGLSRGQQQLTNALAVTPTGAADVMGAAGGGAIGTVLQDVEQGGPADIHLFNAGGVHYVTASSDTAIAPGNSLELTDNGTVQLKAQNASVAAATEASVGAGTIFNAMFD